MNAPPETVFEYVDPKPGDSKRIRWDKNVKNIEAIEELGDVSIHLYICFKLKRAAIGWVLWDMITTEAKYMYQDSFLFSAQINDQEFLEFSFRINGTEYFIIF